MIARFGIVRLAVAMQVLVEPWRGLGNVDETVLDHRGLRVHAHDLVTGRLVARDAVAALGDQLLDQLGARGLVLDQHFGRTEQAPRSERSPAQCLVRPLAALPVDIFLLDRDRARLSSMLRQSG